MLKRRIKTDKPITVNVGGVTFHLLRIGERVVELGVDAPRELPIEFEEKPITLPRAKRSKF